MFHYFPVKMTPTTSEQPDMSVPLPGGSPENPTPVLMRNEPKAVKKLPKTAQL
jgi:hypothetical protein